MESLRQSAGQEYLINICLQNADHGSVEKELGSINGISGIVPIDDSSGALRIRIICQSTEDLRAEIYHKIKDTEWTLLEFHRETQTLENIFRELTREN